MDFRPEAIDLARVAGELERVFLGAPPTGYVLGRTAMRDAVVRFLDCSQLQAEEIIDTMIARGLLMYQGSPAEQVDDLRPWWIAKRPEPT